jgi:hypothetical protein
MAEYAALYEEIMSRYEAKLKTGSIFDHNFPEAKISVEKIDPPNSQDPNSATDKELIETLLKEYHIRLDDLKAHFTQYDAHVERWFNSLLVRKKE